MGFLRLSMAVALSVCLTGESAWGQWGVSCGRWRLPSTCAQYWGYGVGPGHHVPMVRAPGYQPPRIARVTFPPECEPTFCHSGCSHASYSGPGCYSAPCNHGAQQSGGCMEMGAPDVQSTPCPGIFGPRPSGEPTPAIDESEMPPPAPVLEDTTGILPTPRTPHVNFAGPPLPMP